MREALIEMKLVKGLKAAGWLPMKFVSPGNSGVPDRIIFSPEGRVIFVEIKTETGRLTPAQRAQMQRLRFYGQETRVLYGVKDVVAFLDEIRKDGDDA